MNDNHILEKMIQHMDNKVIHTKVAENIIIISLKNTLLIIFI